MASYKTEKGFKFQTLSTDTFASAIEGGTWSAGGNLNTARASQGGAGTASNAALVFGGQTPGNTAVTESYNGSAWTEVNDLNDSRQLLGGTGSQTAALAAGGNSPHDASVESWNGSSWTEVTGLGTARRGNNGLFGVQTAAVFCGGYLPSGPGTGKTEKWNGSAWTETGDLNTSRWAFSSGGTTTAGIAFAGEAPNIAATEEFNGTAWSEVNDLNTGRGEVGGSGGPGSQTSILCFGGGSPPGAKNEHFDGTSWTELNDLSIARNQVTKTNISSPSALCIGGGQPGSPYNAQTEHFDAPSVFSKVDLGQVFYNSTANAFKVTEQPISGGSWSAGANVNTGRDRIGGASQGTPSAGLIFGGNNSPYAYTEEYNGSSWSEQNDLNAGRYISYGGAGSQTACVTAGGYYPSGSPSYSTVLSETYNGTSWTEGNDLNTGRIDCSTFGTSTAGVLCGGQTGPGAPNTVANVELYNGTSWSESTDLPSVNQEMSSVGVNTAGFIVGGSVDTDPSTKNTTFEWDGSSWTAGGNYPVNMKYGCAFGTQTSGIAAGGEKKPGGTTGIACHYNGSSWTEVTEMGTGRNSVTANGTSGLAGFAAVGYPNSTATEFWEVPVTNKTITIS